MTIVVALLVTAWLVLNLIATLAVLRKDELSARKRAIQITLVWLVPCIGAVVCLAFVVTDTLHKNVALDGTAFVDSAGASVPLGPASLAAAHSDSGSSGGDDE